MTESFFAVEVVNFLQKKKYLLSFPVSWEERRHKELYIVGRESYSTEYIMRSGDDEATFQVNIVVKYSKGKYKRNGVKLFRIRYVWYGHSY